MIKVLTIITARASYSRFKGTLLELENNNQIDSKIICTCSALMEKFGNISKVIESDGLNVIRTVCTEVEGNELETMPLTVANTINHLTSIFKNENPDFIVTIADRYETISTAISAAYMNIPLIHIQGGEVTGNIDEKVRHSISKLADFHFVSTDRAKKRLISMGENPKAIFNTGCPSIDIIKEKNEVDIESLSLRLKQLDHNNDLDHKNGFIIMLLHTETENHTESHQRANKILNRISGLNKQLIIFWPNPDAGTEGVSKSIRIFKNNNDKKNHIYVKNLESKFFLKLLDECDFLIGNSSVGIRECSYMGVPVINIGDRQRGRDRGSNVIDLSWEEFDNVDFITILNTKDISKDNLYGDGESSKKISKLISTLPKNHIKEFYE